MRRSRMVAPHAAVHGQHGGIHLLRARDRLEEDRQEHTLRPRVRLRRHRQPRRRRHDGERRDCAALRMNRRITGTRGDAVGARRAAPLPCLYVAMLLGTTLLAQTQEGMAHIPAGDYWMGRTRLWLMDEIGWQLRDR